MTKHFTEIKPYMLEFNGQKHFTSKVKKNVPLNTFHVMNNIFILINKITKCV